MPSSASPSTDIYTLSLHDALPISLAILARLVIRREPHDTSVELIALVLGYRPSRTAHFTDDGLSRRLHEDEVAHAREQIHQLVVIRSEEHTSELQSHSDLVCRLLLRPPPTSTLFPYTTLFRSRSRYSRAS